MDINKVISVNRTYIRGGLFVLNDGAKSVASAHPLFRTSNVCVACRFNAARKLLVRDACILTIY